LLLEVMPCSVEVTPPVRLDVLVLQHSRRELVTAREDGSQLTG
jgi:hypothetical protein